MRSRYSAYAFKVLPYLWRTLHSSHADRQRPQEEVFREWRSALSVQRFTGLKILGARDQTPSGVAQVLFYARIFQRGKDLSFVELSDFVHEDGGWRYVEGILRPAKDFPSPVEQMTLERFI
jgi:SEC-C motif-containing protein